jgi:hypothetical protein
MKYNNFERKLIASRPHDYVANQAFADRVMEKINNPEILGTQMRSMNVTKKETFMTKLKHLPKLAVVAIVLGALLILSGTAYATYQFFWAKPSVHLDQLTTSTSGREEAILSTKECGPLAAQHYELKNGATITADRIPAIVEAQCELKSIDTWAQSVYQDVSTPQPKDGSPYDETFVRVSMATHLQAIQKDSVTFAAIDKYAMPAQSFATSPSVKYIVNGKEDKQSSIHTGDVVAYVVTSKLHLTQTKDGGYSGGGMPAQTLVAVVKLSMPFEDYDQLAWQSLAERSPCIGNPDENCIAGGASIDLYMGGNSKIPEGTTMKEIQGVVTALDGRTVSIKASSGTIYRVTTPTDVITDYNVNKAAQHYNNQKVVIGSSIDVNYNEAPDAHATDINASYMRFMIELVSKGDPVKAY